MNKEFGTNYAIVLSSGGHKKREDGMCLLEAVAFLAGEPHTDKPRCVSPILAEIGRGLNDDLFENDLYKLAPLTTRLIGTANQPEKDQETYFILANSAIHIIGPFILDSVGLESESEKLHSLPIIMDDITGIEAGIILESIAERIKDSRINSIIRWLADIAEDIMLDRKNIGQDFYFLLRYASKVVHKDELQNLVLDIFDRILRSYEG